MNDLKIYSGTANLAQWIEHGQWEQKSRDGAKGLVRDPAEHCEFVARYAREA